MGRYIPFIRTLPGSNFLVIMGESVGVCYPYLSWFSRPWRLETTTSLADVVGVEEDHVILDAWDLDLDTFGPPDSPEGSDPPHDKEEKN